MDLGRIINTEVGMLHTYTLWKHNITMALCAPISIENLCIGCLNKLVLLVHHLKQYQSYQELMNQYMKQVSG